MQFESLCVHIFFMMKDLPTIIWSHDELLLLYSYNEALLKYTETLEY